MRPTFSLRVLFAVMTVAALFVAGMARPTWPLTWAIVVLAGLSFGAALVVGLGAWAHRTFALTYAFVGGLALASILHPQWLWQPMLLLSLTIMHPVLWLYPLEQHRTEFIPARVAIYFVVAHCLWSVIAGLVAAKVVRSWSRRRAEARLLSRKE